MGKERTERAGSTRVRWGLIMWGTPRCGTDCEKGIREDFVARSLS